MANQKKETVATKGVNQTKEYRVIGETFKSKSEATAELKKVFGKGFRSAGLMVCNSEFVILYGTYTTERIANENATVIKKLGLQLRCSSKEKNRKEIEGVARALALAKRKETAISGGS